MKRSEFTAEAFDTTEYSTDSQPSRLCKGINDVDVYADADIAHTPDVREDGLPWMRLAQCTGKRYIFPSLLMSCESSSLCVCEAF